MLSKILLSDEKQAEPVKCEGRVVSSASERRQRDRTVVFEGKWAYMRYQGKTLHLGTVMRIQHELTERSSNLRHGLLGGPILACYSMSASRSVRQIVSSATAKVLWTGQNTCFLGQIAECRFPLAHKVAATCKLIPTKTKGIRAGDPLMIPRAMRGRAGSL